MSETTLKIPHAVKIEESNCVSFKVGLHASLHRSQYDLLQNVSPELVQFPKGMMERWGELIMMECQSPSKGRTYSRFTPLMNEKDAERRRLLASFFGIIRGNIYLPDGPKREAALKLDAKLHRFRGMQHGGSKMARSARIAALEKDLEELKSEVETLSLTATVQQLHEVTTAYESLSMERVKQHVDEKRPTMRETRREADVYYERACRLVEAAHLMATTDEARKAIERLVDLMNRAVRESKRTYHEMLGQRRRYKKKEAPIDGSVDDASGGVS